MPLFFSTLSFSSHFYSKEQLIKYVYEIIQKDGQNKGIAFLKKLYLNSPENKSIFESLVSIFYKLGLNEEIITYWEQASKTIKKQLSPSSRIILASILRDKGKFKEAKKILDPISDKLDIKKRILYAMITLEAGYPKKALAILPNYKNTQLDTDDLAHVAYVLRKANDPATALLLAEKSLLLNPHNLLAIEQKIYALDELGAYHLAYLLAQKYSQKLPQLETTRIKANELVAEINNALAEKKRLEAKYEYKLRNIYLEKVLIKINQFINSLPNNHPQKQRLKNDRIVVLRALEKMEKVIQEYEAMLKKGYTPPPYVRQLVADAYLYQKKPEKAVEIYQKLIKENPNINLNCFLSLYYGLIESEEYNKATSMINNLYLKVPDFVYNKENWEKIDLDDIWIIEPAYRNKESIAEKRAQEMRKKAPANIQFINRQATIARYRGLPEKAASHTKLGEAYAPKDKDILLNRANNAKELGDYEQWEKIIVSLHNLFPKDTAITTSWLELQDLRRPSFFSQVSFGKSRGNNEPTENEDLAFEARFNLPWYEKKWRTYLTYLYRDAHFEEENINFTRFGIGEEWQWKRKHFWIEISSEKIQNKNLGIGVGWAQWLNDNWHYKLKIDSYSSQIPLKAYKENIKGKQFLASLDWYKNESLSASLGIDFLKLSDNNLRTSLGANLNKRLFSSAHHITSGILGLYTTHNSKPGGVYYNPKDTRSISIGLGHDWITWRRYERSFTQHFGISTGLDWQSSYSYTPFLDLEYRHDWNLSRTWTLWYGIGWETHVYDGEREQKWWGILGLKGVL